MHVGVAKAKASALTGAFPRQFWSAWPTQLAAKARKPKHAREQRSCICHFTLVAPLGW
jgi:hypothetical protein